MRLWTEIALPSVVVAEVLRGRCEFVLKATPAQAPSAQLQGKIKTRKRYADVMIAAMALAGNHIVVTRNQTHFADLLPLRQLANWIDNPPS